MGAIENNNAAVPLGTSRIIAHAGAPVSGTSEVQTITIGGTPTAGSFRLTFGACTTTDITWTATDADLVAAILAALIAIPSIGTGGVTVAAGTSSGGIGTILVTFAATLGVEDVPLITATSALTGTAPTLAVATTTAGVNATARGASKGALLTDTTNGIVYINTGTTTAPTWTKVGTQT